MFKKGDKLVMVEDDSYKEFEYPKGTVVEVFEDNYGDSTVRIKEPRRVTGYAVVWYSMVKTLEDECMPQAGCTVRVISTDICDEGLVDVGDLLVVSDIDDDGDLVIDLGELGKWWLYPSQVEVVAKAPENAADEVTSINVDKLIGAIKNYGWTVNETIAYLEGYKEGVNTL